MLHTTIEPLESRIAPATFMVTTLSDITDSKHDTGSLRDALALADGNAGLDTITFKGGLSGVITLSTPLGQLQSAGDVTITGPGANKIIINAGFHERILQVTGTGGVDSPTTISGLTFFNGNAGVSGNGGAISSNASLTLKNCIISGNEADNGGGVFVEASGVDGSSVNITNCTFQGNQAFDAGGYAYGGGAELGVAKSIVISGSHITGNKANYGGGVFAKIVGTDLKSGITISSSVVSGNRALRTQPSSGGPVGGYGGGLYVADNNPLAASVIKITGSTIVGNAAVDDGSTPNAAASGGGIFAGAGNLVIQSTTLAGNIAGQSGGGFFSKTFTSLSLVSAKVTGNQVTNSATTSKGGGLYLGGAGTASIKSTTVSGNESVFGGGGLFTGNGVALAISGSSILSNSAIEGGGIFASGLGTGSSSSLTISATKITGNLAIGPGGIGGGIYEVDNGPFTIKTSQITGNIAQKAGGLYLDGKTTPGTFSLTTTSIIGNVAGTSYGGGLIATGTGLLTITGGSITGNDSSFKGGGIFVGDELGENAAIHGSITGTKITENFAIDGGGIFSATTGVITLGKGTVVAGNVAGTDPDKDGI